jgi:ABC-2 type transport system ATP-binding protein
MKEENAIEVRDITKNFKVYMDKGHTLKEKFLFKNSKRYEERQVLKGISFEVKKGEAIGLIGHNGCGKSTTLKLLTRIMYPDSGTIEMRGRVSSLIELGAGFHPDMSGRQNIYTNASIFGLNRKEIDERIENIIEFSELREFIDNPVRTYSSGMYMRLAFAVAINVDADILLIDEILAVGDASFQAKCFNKLMEIKGEGTTIVIVSHSLGQIEQICERSIWIDEGKIRMEGSPKDVHPEYLKYMGLIQQTNFEKEQKRIQDKALGAADGKILRKGSGEVRIQNVSARDDAGNVKFTYELGENINFDIHYKVNAPLENAAISFNVYRIDGVHCYGISTRTELGSPLNFQSDNKLQLVWQNVELLSGEYFIDFQIEDCKGSVVDFFEKSIKIMIRSLKYEVGIYRIKHLWKQ